MLNHIRLKLTMSVAITELMMHVEVNDDASACGSINN
jgi:hypothetical protein